MSKQTELQKLEQQAIEMMKQNSTRSMGVNNNTILFELLTDGNQYPRLTAPVKAASLYFSKQGVTPNEDEFMKKITSIKNSLDTLVSNYNNPAKIERHDLLRGTELVNVNGMLSITK